MNTFPHHFDRTVVISLPERGDRRARLMANLRECRLADHSDIFWQDAVNGQRAKIPSWWTQGPGAWGCRASHLATLTEAQHDGVERLLIIKTMPVFIPARRHGSTCSCHCCRTTGTSFSSAAST